MTDNEFKAIAANLDRLHVKILNHKFAKVVSENEVMSLALAVKTINRQQAEIERLEKENSLCVKIAFDMNELQEIADKCVKNIEIDINLAKSDAIKDFSKAMIDKINGDKISSTDIVDFTVDYLRGENNGKL